MRITEGARSVVTGAGSGIGRALCLELARRKARVLAADVRLDRAEETSRRVQANGGECHSFKVDVSRLSEVKAMREKARRLWGGTDLLVNNAGVVATGRVGTISLEDWSWVHQIDFWGVLYGCHFFLPDMIKRGSGAILNVASGAGVLPQPELGAYNTAKAAVVSLTETMYGELTGTGVSATVVCPMGVRTNILENSRHQTEEMRLVAGRGIARTGRSAEFLARRALRDLEQGRLYSLPMWEGRLLWRLKRAFPHPYMRVSSAQWGRIKNLLIGHVETAKAANGKAVHRGERRV